MQSPAQVPPSSPSSSFAGLFAHLAAPEKKFPPARDLDGLADDIATLTYEHALRAHARYRPVPDSPEVADTTPAQPSFAGGKPVVAPVASSDPAKPSLRTPVPLSNANSLKKASVTVRLTPAENDQLRQRAAEAGITVSAYLRSCAFEVETLRAQVKQTLAELRHPAPAKKPRQGMLFRLFPWIRQTTSAKAS